MSKTNDVAGAREPLGDQVGGVLADDLADPVLLLRVRVVGGRPRFLDRADSVSYLAAAVVSNNRDGFNNNLYLSSAASGAPLRLTRWDLDRCWQPSGSTIGRVWLNNQLFERVFALPSVRQEVLERVARAVRFEESTPRFGQRCESLAALVARAYEEDPALGGLSLPEEAARLRAEYEAWLDFVVSSEGADELLGARRLP